MTIELVKISWVKESKLIVRSEVRDTVRRREPGPLPSFPEKKQNERFQLDARAHLIWKHLRVRYKFLLFYFTYFLFFYFAIINV